MAIDPEVMKAIKDAVKEEGQPEAVASLLIAWLQDMSNAALGELDNTKHLELVQKEITIVKKGEDDEN